MLIYERDPASPAPGLGQEKKTSMARASSSEGAGLCRLKLDGREAVASHDGEHSFLEVRWDGKAEHGVKEVGRPQDAGHRRGSAPQELPGFLGGLQTGLSGGVKRCSCSQES